MSDQQNLGGLSPPPCHPCINTLRTNFSQYVHLYVHVFSYLYHYFIVKQYVIQHKLKVHTPHDKETIGHQLVSSFSGKYGCSVGYVCH